MRLVFFGLLVGCGGAEFSAVIETDAAADVAEEDAGHEARADAQFVADVTPAPEAEACVAQSHHNGLGQTFQDCAPPGTYNQAQAFEACAAFTGDATKCTPRACPPSNVVCSDTFSACACWAYSGPSAGHVGNAGAPGNCTCPGVVDPGWN